MKQDRATPALVVGALGVVFGDIGIGPPYAMRGILEEGDDLSQDTVYGCSWCWTGSPPTGPRSWRCRAPGPSSWGREFDL